MQDITCPECGGEMDEGSVSTGDDLRYLSNHQKGMLCVPTLVQRARSCLTCGDVELYLDASELKKKIRQ